MKQFMHYFSVLDGILTACVPAVLIKLSVVLS